MNVTRITQLFSVQGGLSSNARTSELQSQPQPSTTASNTRAGQDDAASVKVSNSSDPVARNSRIAELRAAVQGGNYEFNRTGVATALYRDLA